jgi:hypothetical protein
MTAQPIEVVFTGKVQSVHHLQAWSGKALLAGFDPRFAVVLAIQSVETEDAPFAAGAQQTFAIHSLAHSFLDAKEAMVGKTYRLRLRGEVADGRTEYLSLSPA